jgi:hypothetical protein
MLVQTAFRSIGLITDLALILTLDLISSTAVASWFFIRLAHSHIFIAIALAASSYVNTSKGTLKLRFAQLVVLEF